MQQHSFPLFFGAFVVVFLFSGAGNGSVYRMIPSIFAQEAARTGGDRLEFKRRAAGAIGIAGALGAFGGFLIQLAFRQASVPVVTAVTHATKTIHAKPALHAELARIAAAHATWSIPALWGFVGVYVFLGGLTWWCYLRRTGEQRARGLEPEVV